MAPAAISMLPAGASAKKTGVSRGLLGGPGSPTPPPPVFAESAPWFTRAPRLRTDYVPGGASSGALASPDNRAAFGRAPPPLV